MMTLCVYPSVYYFKCVSFDSCCIFFVMIRRPPRSTRTDTLFPYTTRFRSDQRVGDTGRVAEQAVVIDPVDRDIGVAQRTKAAPYGGAGGGDGGKIGRAHV